MAVVTIPATATEQPVEGQTLGESGTRGFTRAFKDRFSVLVTALAGISTGDTLGGRKVVGCDLARSPGDLGVLTFRLAPSDDDGGLQGNVAQRAVWTCRSVRNDVSVLAYCGGSASRLSLELWMKEADGTLAEANSFHKTDTEKDMLNSDEIKIANKIRKGVESVIRFYPVLSCTSYWTRVPRTFMERLGYVDTPGAPDADETIAPSNLSAIISAHSWLKVQDDVSETGDGRHQRVESWMGVPNTDGNGWDEDLYGDNRWPMPIGGGAS